MQKNIKNILTVVLSSAFVLGLFLWGVFKPDDKESLSERRALALFPKISKESIVSGSFMEEYEAYTLDQFPLRDGFRRVKALTSLYVLGQRDNNGIYVKDGYASKLEYPLDRDSVKYATSRFQFVYDKYLTGKDINVYLSVIPDKNHFMASKNGYMTLDYKGLISDTKKQMSYAKYIDITGLLELSDYYRTDTHWRQEKIGDVAKHLAADMGVLLQGEYTANRVDKPFYGVYCGQSALPLAPDDLYYLNNNLLAECKVYDFETDSYITVYDLEKTGGQDPYEMFLSGPKSLLTIENPNASTIKELIIFRDSFGSSIAPLLAEGYSKITLVDIRYISPNVLDRFIEFNDQDVLFLYSTLILNNSVTIK